MATPRKSQTLARGTRRLADASLPDLTKPQLLTYADASAVLGLGIPTLERMVANSTFRTVPGAMENVVPVERIELPTFGLQNLSACHFPVSSCTLFTGLSHVSSRFRPLH